MKILKYLLFLLLVCSSCNRKKQVTETVYPSPFFDDSYVYYSIKDNRIEVNMNEKQQVSFFDYFNHIELIPLETNDDVLIGKCEEIIHYQSRYYIFDSQQRSIFVFDDAGKFLFQINKRGQGRGEYNEIKSILLNSFTGNIDILGLGFIYSYDLTGKHVNTYSLINLHPPIYPFNFIALNEKTYVFYSAYSTKYSSYRISYLDVEKSEIFHQEYEEDEFLNTFMFISTVSHSPFYEYHGKWFFSRFVDNITYEVGPNSLINAYKWDFGKLNYEAKKLNLPNDFSSISSLPYRISFQMQNNKYVVAWIRFRNSDPNTGVYFMYNKSTNECKYIESFSEQVDFLPRKITNEYVLSCCYHGELQKYISEEMLDETNNKKFIGLMNTKDEMNPIIIKYYFK